MCCNWFLIFPAPKNNNNTKYLRFYLWISIDRKAAIIFTHNIFVLVILLFWLNSDFGFIESNYILFKNYSELLPLFFSSFNRCQMPEVKALQKRFSETNKINFFSFPSIERQLDMYFIDNAICVCFFMPHEIICLMRSIFFWKKRQLVQGSCF